MPKTKHTKHIACNAVVRQSTFNYTYNNKPIESLKWDCNYNVIINYKDGWYTTVNRDVYLDCTRKPKISNKVKNIKNFVLNWKNNGN